MTKLFLLEFAKNGDGGIWDNSYGYGDEEGAGCGHFYRPMNNSPHYTEKTGSGYTAISLSLSLRGGSDGGSDLRSYGSINGLRINAVIY